LNTLVKPHSLYEALDSNYVARLAAYRELFRYELEVGMVDKILQATNGNFALGNESFAAQVAAIIGRRAIPGHAERPRKMLEPESQELVLE
jgi:putative transposase